MDIDAYLCNVKSVATSVHILSMYLNTVPGYGIITTLSYKYVPRIQRILHGGLAMRPGLAFHIHIYTHTDINTYEPAYDFAYTNQQSGNRRRTSLESYPLSCPCPTCPRVLTRKETNRSESLAARSS